MKIKILFVALICSTFSWAQIAAWQLNGAAGSEASINASTIDANLNTATLIRNGGLTASALVNSFSATNFTATGTRADAVTNNRGQSFTISPKVGYAASLSTLDVRFRRSTTGPNAFAWFYSLDGVSFTQIASDISYTLTTTGGDAQTQLNLSGIAALQNVPSGTTITFRLNAWGASAATGTFAIGRSLTTGATDYSLAIGGTVNPTGPCVVPLSQATAVALTNPTVGGATLSWTNGAASSGSMVVIRPTASVLTDPSTGTSYTPNASYASAAQIDTNNRVVYLGSGTTVNVTGLSAETQYTATIYSYNLIDCYNTTAPATVNFYTLSVEPTAHAALSCSLPTPTQITLTFGAANTIGGDGYLILYRIGAAPTGVPVDGASYTAGTVFGDATVLGQTDSLGTATTFVATGLNSSTVYYFSLVPFKQNAVSSATYNYRTAATIPTCTSTTTVASAVITLSNNGTQPLPANVPQGTTSLILSQFKLAVTTSNATVNGIVNIVTTGTYTTTDIVNLKVRYSTDAVLDVTDVTLSTLTTPGAAGTKSFVAFAAPQTIILATTGFFFITADVSATAVLGNTIGLNAIAIAPNNFAFAGTPGKSGSTTACGTQTFSQSAPAVPATFTKGCTTNTTQILNWTAPATGTFDGYFLVARAAGSPSVVTTIVASTQATGLDFSVAPIYNAGTTSKALYVGTATTATVTGLTAGINYEFNLYAYKNNGAAASLFSVVTTTTQTLGLPNVTGANAISGSTTGTISWTNPTLSCYDEVMAVVTTAAGITFVPSGNGSAYTANSVYTTPNQVVYNGASSSVTITGLANGTTYYVEIFVRKGTEWSSGVEVSVTPNTSTIFKPGELLFVGFDGQYLGSGSNDQYMVATMVDILPGTTFSIANSRYEAGAAANVRTDEWGGPGNDPSQAPGVTIFTYNGSGNITAGSVLVLNTNLSNAFSYAGVITGTTLTDRTTDFAFTQPFTTSGAPNISTTNGDGEQMYLLQGNFISDGIIDANQANYILSGTLLHGFTIKTGWVPLTSACSGVVGAGSYRQSRLPSSLTCFNIESAVSTTITGFYKNSSEHGITSLRNIIKAVANVSTNWTLGTSRYTIDATSSLATRAGKTFLIGAGNPSGQWRGDVDTNWFNCANWERLTVPDEFTDVIVDPANVTDINNAIVNFTAAYSDTYSDLATCRNLTINGRKVVAEGTGIDNTGTSNKLQVYGDLIIAATGTLDMDDSNAATADGQINLYGNWTNNLTTSAFLEGNGTVDLVGSNPQIINANVHTNPEQFYNVILDNNFNTAVSNNLIATGNLEVKTNKIVAIATNDYIQVNKKLTHNGDLAIANSGQLIQVDEVDTNDGDYSGTKFQVTRTAMAKNFDYIYWSAPTAGFSVSSLPTNNRYEWSTLNANANGTQGNWVLPTTATMTKGRGYIARASNGQTSATSLTTLFKGQPNNGLFNYPIYRGTNMAADYDADPADPNNIWTTKYDDNWNLLGNPYPSAIDALEFITLNQTKINGAVWIWKHGFDPVSSVSPFYSYYTYNYSASSDYIKFNAMGSSDPVIFAGGKIASGQAFMVNMNDELSAGVPNPSGNTVTFSNALRTGPSTAVYNNSDFFRSSTQAAQQPEERHRMWLDITNNASGQTDRMLLGYATSATLGRDNLFDCFTILQSEVSMYSLINNEAFVIQGRPLPFDDTDLVPIGFKIVTAGTHTIAIKKVDGLFEQSQPIYLEDKLLNIIYDLKQAPYTFTSGVGTFNNRFIIRYTNAALSSNNLDAIDNNVMVASHNAQITIRSAVAKMTAVSIYDLLGREIVTKTNVSENEILFTNVTAKNQALIVKIKLENGATVTRKIILQ